ncbi:cytochrome P450 [Podospora aff. communis PSN243]|uniref:Cytochrome P450 n=1 Tax=Podospora aff. communis PSN243 TaxID=3040156 RepID=A0AAV9GCS1_9PEZI|nr:cytochrome P450 [Podospora aff. communis PSN243]
MDAIPLTWQNAAVLLSATTALYFLFRTIYNLYFHPLAKIPGLSSWSASHIPFAWAVFRGSYVPRIFQLHQKYGPIVRIAPDAVCFAQAEAWSEILQPPPSRPETILKCGQWFKPQPGMALSLSQALEPETHAHLKKSLLPAFTARALRAQEPFIQRYVNLLVERLRDIAAPSAANKGGAEVDMVSWLNWTVFDIFGDLGFGESFGSLEHSRYHPWVSIIFSNIKGIALMRAVSYFPTLESLLQMCIPPSFHKMQRDHIALIEKKIQRRLNYEFERPDIMSHVYGDVKGPGKADRLPDESITSLFWELVLAGSETTATTLAGTVNYLTSYPSAQKKLAAEVRAKFKTSESISLDGLQDLPYLNAVIKEGLRLCPPFPWIIPRTIPEGGRTICGAWMPAGTKVSIHTNAIHRNPDYFYNPVSFLPERWLPDASTDPKSPFFTDHREAMQAFAVGPRACIGQNLAMAEMRLIVAKLVWSFDLELPADKRKWVRWEDLKAFIVMEKPPINLVLKLRQ